MRIPRRDPRIDRLFMGSGMLPAPVYILILTGTGLITVMDLMTSIVMKVELTSISHPLSPDLDEMISLMI
jgi:hypothetical protein